MLIKSGRWVVALAVLSGALVQSAGASPDSVVTVGAMTGKLSVQRKTGRGFVALTSGQSLFAGDIVATGANSKASLLFPDGAQLRINANSSIEIPEPRRLKNGKLSLFKAINGQVWARLRPGNAIETRTAVLGVRGTEVLLDVAADGTSTLTVTDGSVDFANDLGAVVVNQGQRSIARPGAAPTAPITADNAGFITEWTFDLDRASIPREKFFVTPDRAQATRTATQLAPQVVANSVDADLRRNYGDALFDSGQYDAAAREYSVAARLSPGDEQMPVRLGYALLEAGRIAEAQRTFLGSLGDGAQTRQVDFDLGREVSLEAQLASFGPLNTDAAPALVGLADLALVHDRPRTAQIAAQMARATGAPGSQANLALGVALLRQPGQSEAAVAALQDAAQDAARPDAYQAHAWLALAYLGQDDHASALREAQRATEMAPHSGLARGNLALVYFYSGQSEAAQREAQKALQLNPESVAARVTLGQAALSRGDVDGANYAAAQAVALDPDLPQARYLLGVSDASRRDYRHAERELKAAVALAPDFLEANSALARVYTVVGRPNEATTLLKGMLPRYRQSDAVLGALGGVYYEQGLYQESVQSYQDALRKNPNSALYQAELARTLLYSNRLNEAVAAGSAAVSLAPHVGQYHAILGLAYEYGSLPSQAEREFRTALTLDPQNALALTQLAYRHTGNDLRPAAAGFAQGFLLDPGVGRQLLRGGTNLETTPTLGNGDGNDFGLSHRNTFADGKANAFGFLNRSSKEGLRDNDNGRGFDVAEHFTYLPSQRTNVYAALRLTRDKNGLPGAVSDESSDDNARFGYGQAQIAVRQRFAGGAHLWAGLFANDSRNDARDPDLNSFFDEASGLTVAQQKFTSRALEPEVRLDVPLGRTAGRSGLLSLGAAQTSTRFRSDRALQGDLSEDPTAFGNSISTQTNSGYLGYAQLAQQFGPKFSLVGQLRLQQLSRTLSSLSSLDGANAVSGDSLGGLDQGRHTYFLPSLVATYQPAKRTTLRLSLNQRVTDVTASTFAPTETLLTTERSSLPFGTPGRLNMAQLDVERYVSSRGFLKAFAFSTRADDVQIGYSDLLGFGSGLPGVLAPGLNVSQWRGEGVGVRYEHRLARSLFANVGGVLRRTRAQSGDSIGLSYDGADAPYEPKLLANLDLNYLDAGGNKVGLRLRHSGAFYQDSPLALGRSRFTPQTYVDVLLAKEFSLRSEVFLNVTNVFNRSQIAFRDFPIGQRQVNFGITRRF